MGGKAFGFEAKRMCVDEYNDVVSLTRQRINSVCEFDSCAAIVSVKEKDSFGDVDILVVSEHFSFDKFWDKHKYRYKDHVKNGGVYSLLDKRDRQIDIITTPKNIFTVHYNYLSYNDLGNFIGRLARGINLKYGHDGLHLIVRHNNDVSRKIGELKLSTSTEYIYHKLDVDFPEHGFNNMTEVYDAIMKSKFYHKDLFLLEKQSNKARVRDRKRKSYNDFLSYIKEHDKSDKPRRRYTMNETLMLFNKDIVWDYVNMCADGDEKLYKKTIFNGAIVKEITGLSGKELGVFMATFKDSIDYESNINEQIKSHFDKFIGVQ